MRKKCDQERGRKDFKIWRLSREIQRKRNVKTKMTPVIREPTGTISKSLWQYLSNVTGNIIKKLPKKNCHIEHRTDISENTNVKVQKHISRAK